MVKETKINGKIIVEQTTYYLYMTEEDRKKDNYAMTSSNKKDVLKQCE